TPDGTTVLDYSIYYYPDVESPDRSYYNSRVVFESAVPAPDMVTLFQTEMVANGFVQTGDSIENDDGRQLRFLQFSVPTSTYERAEVVIGIVDSDADYAQIEITDGLDPAIADAFSAWPVGIPLLDQVSEF